MSFSRVHFILAFFCAGCIIAGFGLSSAFGKDIKRYTIQSGEVHYKIQGSGNMMGTQMSSSGEKSLYFKDYGSLIMEEETVKESTSGLAGNNQETKHSMTKTDQENIYKVDFKRKKIFVLPDPGMAIYAGKNMGEEAEKMLTGLGGKKIGSDKVLGYTCTIWSLMGGKQCLYQNQIPLWLEVDIMGIKTRQTAVSVKFNHRVSDNHFQLPDFPVEKGFGEGPEQKMSEQEAEQMAAMMQALGQAANQAQKNMQDNPNMSEKELEQQLLAALSQNPQMNNELKKIQHDMPVMLKLTKEYRSCLRNADNRDEAQSCLRRAEQKAQRLGLPQDLEDRDEQITSWSAEDKTRELAELDKSITEMEKAMPCIQRAKNIMELQGCPGFN